MENNNEELNNRYHFDKENHVHLLDNEPLMGTTTLIKEVYPPMLSWWGSGMACKELGWLNPKEATKEARLESAEKALNSLSGLTSQKYLAKLDEAYKAHDQFKKEAGKKGTAAHDLIEKYINECLTKNGGKPIPASGEMEQFARWAGKDVDRFVFSEKYVYSEKLWVGGIVDFAFYDKSQNFIVGDRKTAKAIYNTNFYQTAGYGLQMSENGVFTASGERLLAPIKQIDGYCIFQQKEKGESTILYRTDVEFLENIFRHTVLVYCDKQDFGYKITKM